MKITNIKRIALVLIIFFSVGYFLFSTKEVKSFYNINTNPLSPGQFGGYAWSKNIGWIDMNGVYFDLEDPFTNPVKDISGYAWSPNIGWISFTNSDLVNCPLAPCKAQINLHGISKTNPNAIYGANLDPLLGWAKVLSLKSTIEQNYDTEIDTNTGSFSEHADGWIKLSNGNILGGEYYGVGCGALAENILNPNSVNPKGLCSGYAWGGNVVGWINFNEVGVGFKENPTKRIHLIRSGEPSCGFYNISPCSSIGSGIHQFNFSWDYGDFVPILKFVGGVYSLENELDNTFGNKCNIYDTYNGTTTLAYPASGGSVGSFYLPQATSPSNPYSNITGALNSGLHSFYMKCLKKDGSFAVSNIIYFLVSSSLNIPLPSPIYIIECANDTHGNNVIFKDATGGVNDLYKGKSCTGSFSAFFTGNVFPNNLPFTIEDVPEGVYTLKCNVPNYETETGIIEVKNICKKRIPKIKEN